MYDAPFPDERPVGLRRRSLRAGTELWRIEAIAPDAWTWTGHPEPRHRFDPATGTFRTRYAGKSFHGAARERYLDTGLLVPSDHDEHWVVRLTAARSFSVLDLRTEANLAALAVDDRISTSHEAAVWDACHRLADAARAWWPDLDGIVYRSRTTPASSTNVAFFSAEALEADARLLGDCRDELDDLVLHHQFTVDFDW